MHATQHWTIPLLMGNGTRDQVTEHPLVHALLILLHVTDHIGQIANGLNFHDSLSIDSLFNLSCTYI